MQQVMNDYKELIEKFRAKRNDGWQKDGSYQEQIITVQDILDAADVIEQLTKERDAAVSDLKEAMPCRACKHLADLEYCKNCYLENHWEWRGIDGRI